MKLIKSKELRYDKKQEKRVIRLKGAGFGKETDKQVGEERERKIAEQASMREKNIRRLD